MLASATCSKQFNPVAMGSSDRRLPPEDGSLLGGPSANEALQDSIAYTRSRPVALAADAWRSADDAGGLGVRGACSTPRGLLQRDQAPLDTRYRSPVEYEKIRTKQLTNA